MLKNIRLRAKVLLMLLLISLITAGVVGTIAFTLGTNTLKEESYKKLTAIREMKANQIENYFQEVFNQVITFSESRTVIEATLDLRNGFDRLEDELNYSKNELSRIDSALHVYYQTEFLEQLFYRDSTINYFSLPEDELRSSQALWMEIAAADSRNSNQNENFPKYNPNKFFGQLNISGSSTVASLVRHMVKLFKEEGAIGEITYESTGTSKGLEKLVSGNETDIVGISHKLNPEENKLFKNSKQTPLSFRIGTDAIIIVASDKNNFLNNLSSEDLKKVFTTASTWADINPNWPDERIKRFIPTEGSGSYSIFSNIILGGDQKALINAPNTTEIIDGTIMREVMSNDPNTIAFFSYNYYSNNSFLRIVDIDRVKLDNKSIRNKTYPLIRPLYLVTTEEKLKSNSSTSHFINFFLSTIEKEIGTNLNKIDYWPQHANQRILQYQYIANNPFPKGNKDSLVQIGESISYNTAHQSYHPIFKNYLDRFGYYDIFIITADSGHVIYSVSKEIDFATDILLGPYHKTNLSDAFKHVMESDDPNFIYFEDFSPYLPSYNAPASFIASPIFDGDNKLGALVFQLPIDKINNIMTDDYHWEDVGLGKSGETYLVGRDYLIRNQSRFLVEEPETYFQSLEKTDLSHDIISKIKILNSAIGLQPVITKGTQAAIKGETGTQKFYDYRGVEVLSAYKPLNIDRVNWVILSEIDKDEAFAAIPAMAKSFLFWFSFLLVLVIILSFLFARSISKPVQILTQRASDLANGNLEDTIKIEQTDEIGLLADNFELMRCSVKKLVGDLEEINQNLEKKVDQRTVELNRAKEAADAILDKSPVPVAVVDISTTKFLRVNAAMTEFNKLETAELLKRSTLDIYFNEKQDRLKVIDQLQELGRVENLELHLKRIGTEEERWGLVSIHPISYLDKEVYITSIIDITERKESEAKLYSANQQIQGIVDSLADALIIINEEGIIEAFSPSAEQLFQFRSDEVIGNNINMLMPSPYSENHSGYLKRYKETGVAKIIGREREVEAIKKDGSIFPARLMISEVLSGNKRQFVGLVGDLTARKKAEKRLKSQSTALKSAANGIVITDIEGNIEWVNPAFTELTGYPWKDVIGKKTSILKSDKHDEGYFKNLWDTILKGNVWHEEIVNKKKNGDLYNEEMTITPIFNDDGKITQFVAIKQDITDRKKAEEEIIASENKFRSIASTASDAIISSDKNGLIESWNDAAQAIFGYTEKEALKQPLTIIIPEKFHDQHSLGINRVLEGGAKKLIGQVVEVEGQRKNGQIFPIEISLSDWHGQEGIHFSAIIRDITERKIIEKALNKANKRMQGELNVAKDIQMSMLPLIFPAFPKRNEIDLYAKLIPAREVGGDFYDFYFLDENHICFVVGDVSGKGVPAALMMAVTKTLLKSQAGTDKSTASILTHVNNEIAKDNDTYMFITVFMAILDTNTGELVYSNAGHNPSYVMNKDKNDLIKLGDLHGPVVGAMENMTYGETRLSIGKDDIVITYTDGITESQNEKEELYSDDRFMDFLIKNRDCEPNELIDKVIESVKTFENGAEQFDDITIMAFKYLQEPNTVSSDTTSIEIRNDLKEITTVIDHFEEFGIENNIPFAIIQKFNIAFDELLNNNISYGFQDDKDHLILINIELKGDRLIITLTDDGIPFNPFVKNPPDTMLSVKERDVGGLGIHIVKNLMDEYEYKRNADKNIITLIKHNINK